MKTIHFSELSTCNVTASADVDYRKMQHNSVTVEARQSKTIYIDIIDDSDVESNETFLVEISGAAVGIGINIVEVTIVDDDGKYISVLVDLRCRTCIFHPGF